MTVWGVTMVRDEMDVIEGTLRHMADEVDGLLVADNGSVDGTRELLDHLATQLPNMLVVDDPDPAYYQSLKMSRLAAAAAGKGATWVVPFDADEIWTSPYGRLGDVLAGSTDTVLAATLTDHYRSGQDVDDPDPRRSMVWRSATPSRLPKVAFRYVEGAVIEQGNHGVQVPGYPYGPIWGVLTVDHFPYRSREQFVRKARNGAQAYAATDLDPSYGAHWRSYGGLAEMHGDEAAASWFDQHFYYPDPIAGGLVLFPAPYMRWRS